MVTTQAGVDLESFEYDRALETYRSRYDKTAMSTSMAVIATLSEVTETCPMDLSPLSEAIDTDALDQLFSSHDGTARKVSVTFVIEEHTITVYGNGEITVSHEVESTPLA